MSGYLDLKGPDNVAGAGGALAALAAKLRSEINQLHNEIGSIEGERPWGDDQFGQQFAQTYLEPAADGERPLREVVQDAMTESGHWLEDFGNTTVSGVGLLIHGDDDVVADIRAAGADS